MCCSANCIFSHACSVKLQRIQAAGHGEQREAWSHGMVSVWQILLFITGPEGSLMSKGRAIAAAMAGAMDGESTKLTDDAVVLLEQQYGPLDRNLPTGGSFGELSLADAKLARRNATIVAAEPASLIRIDKQLYRKTLYEMQVSNA